MSYPAHEILGAIQTVDETVAQNATVITAKGLTPANIRAALAAAGTNVSQADTTQENAKSALAAATINYSGKASEAVDLLSSMIDMLAGAVGKKTPLGKQFLAIRKKLNKKKNSGSSGSSSSTSGGGSSSSGGGSSSSSGGDSSSSSSS